MHINFPENSSSYSLRSQSDVSEGDTASSRSYRSTHLNSKISNSAHSNLSSSREGVPKWDKPQTYRVKAVEAQRHAHTFVQTRMFQRVYDMSPTKKVTTKAQEAINHSQIILNVKPLPAEKSSRLNSHFFSKTTYFETILTDSRDPDADQTITAEDLDYVLVHCKVKKYQILCFRILYSLAEHQWQLPEHAIVTLVEECRRLDNKTLPYVVMALGYTVYYQPHIVFQAEVIPLFDEAIEKIWKERSRRFLEVTVVLIAGKAKLGCPITQNDFQKIQQVLAEENDPVIPNLYSPSPLLLNDQEVRSLSRFKTWNKIKTEVKRKKRLSNEELKDIFNYYIITNDRNNKNQILCVIRYAVLNGQYTLPDSAVVVLKEALGEQDFRLRSQALEIAKCLSSNEMLSEDLKEAFVQARHRERFFALTALNSFMQNGGLAAVLREVVVWRRLIDALKENNLHNNTLRSLASYTLFQIDSTLAHIEMLILDSRFCIWATGVCLNAVRNQESLSGQTIRHLTDLVMGYHRELSLEALINTISIFRHMAEQSQPFDENILSSVLELYHDSSTTKNVKKSILLLLGSSISLYPAIVMKEELLVAILKDLKQRELIEGLCFILVQWLDGIEISHSMDTFNLIFVQMMEWIPSPELTFKERKTLTRAIGQGFQKGIKMSSKGIKEFIRFANGCGDLSFQYCSVQALFLYLSTLEKLSWFQPLIDLVLTLSKSGKEVHFLHARAFLSRYMAIIKVDESLSSQITPLIQLLAQESTVSLGVDIFRELVNRKILLSNKALKMIASAMVNENFDVEVDLAFLLLAEAQNRSRIQQRPFFTQKAIDKVVMGLFSSNEMVIDCCVQILHLNSLSSGVQIEKLDKEGVSTLTKVVRIEHFSKETRLQALSILYDLSFHQGVVFSLETIDELRINLEDQEQAIQLATLNVLAAQIEILSVSPLINSLLQQIERSILALGKEGFLLKESMKVLFSLSRSKYKLSIKSLEWIAEALYSEQDIEISNHVCDLLKLQLSNYPGMLTDRISIIFDIQRAIVTLRQRSGVINTKIAAIKNLTRMLKQNQRMITAVFIAMIDLIDQYKTKLALPSSQKLLRNMIRFCEEFLHQEQFVPPRLLQCISHLPGDQLISDCQRHRIQLLARCLQRNNSVDPIAFPLIEEGFLSHSDDKDMLLYLDALDVIVKRGYRLREVVIDRLWNILFDSADQEVLSAAEILFNFFQLQSSTSLDGLHLFRDRIEAKIKITSSEEVKEKLENLFQLVQGLNQTKIYCRASKKEKNLYTLIDEMRSLVTNSYDAVLLQQIQSGYFERCLANVDALSSHDSERKWLSATSVFFSTIHTWTQDDIKAWSQQIRQWIKRKLAEPPSLTGSSPPHSHIEEAMLPECLAIFRRACLLIYGYEPRTVQLLALLALTNRTAPGILGQISTGEGKSLIIAMLSVIKALQGKSVDILTSSAVLASRDARSFQNFYKLFDLKCATNEDQSYQQGLKVCYQEDVNIVYGEACHFQYDELRHSYSGLRTRGTRCYDFLILDEVDNILVEGNDTLAMLSSPIPGMQELTPLLISIWLELHHLEKLRKGTISLEQDNPFDLIDRADQEAVRRTIETELLGYVERIIERGITVPNHLKRYVSAQTKNWIHSAWLAFYVYQPQFQYEIKYHRQQEKGCIAPVDFANTGVIQVGTSWSDGLQQFLQMKHGLAVEPLNLVTNYSSIYSFIRRYSEKIGITGTLGSTQLKALLKDPELYGFSCVEIPTFLPTQMVKLDPLVLPNEEVWLKAVISGAIREAGLGRVVLVICETIDVARQVEVFIRSSKTSVQLYSYTDDKNESTHFLDRKLDGNTIIVATNLAGRGTDLRLTQEAIRLGGLHVFVTFLPVNSRVELQAFGRTGRRGEPGSVQLVLNKETLFEQLKSSSAEDIELLSQESKLIDELRDKEECVELKEIKEYKLPGLLLQERLFSAYLGLIKQVSDNDTIADCTGKRKGFAEQSYHHELREIKKRVLEERWGRWLKNHLRLENEEETWQSFEEFKIGILNDYHGDCFVDNPIYFIRLGNQLLMQANSYRYVLFKKDLLRLAIRTYDAACLIDPIFSYNAYYHKGYALLLLRDKGYKKQAKEALNQMVNALVEGPFRHWQSSYLLLHEHKQCDRESKTYLLSQLEQQLQAYLLLLQSTQNVIKEIDESMKLIELRFGPPCYSQMSQERFSKKRALEILNSENIPQTSIEVIFYHLKTHVDLTQRSQLRETIHALPQELPVTLTFHSDKLYSVRSLEYGLGALLPLNQRSFQPAETFSTKEENAPSSFLRLKIMSSCAMTLTRSSKRKRLESMLVTLTLFQIPVSSIVEMLAHSDRSEEKFSPFQLFGIGPIKLTEACLTLLIDLDPTLQVSIATPEDDHSFPVRIAVSEITLDNIPKEISIVECQTQLLREVLNCISPEEKLFLTIHALEQKKADQWIRQTVQPMALHFVDLDHRDALDIVDMTSDEHSCATLSVRNLSSDLAKRIIPKASRSQQDLTIRYQQIETELSKICHSRTFLENLYLDGYCFLYDVKEDLPLPWRSLAIISTLGVLQIAGGIALKVANKKVKDIDGIWLISEGISDIFRSYQIFSKREFNMMGFLLQKSLTIGAALVSTDSSQGRTHSRSRHLTRRGKNFSNVSRRITNFSRQAALKIGETAIGEGIAETFQIASRMGIYQGQKVIKKNVNHPLQEMLNNESYQKMLNKLLGIDAFLENCVEYENIKIQVSKLFASMEPNGGQFSVFDGRVLNMFIRKFFNTLRDRLIAVKLCKTLFTKKMIDLGLSDVEFDQIFAWLQKENIIDSQGVINTIQLSGYRRGGIGRSDMTFKYEIDEYDLGLFTCSPLDEVRRAVFSACLIYVRCMQGDYSLKRKELLEFISDHFCSLFESRLQDIVNTSANTLNFAAQMGISIGGGLIADKVKGSRNFRGVGRGRGLPREVGRFQHTRWQPPSKVGKQPFSIKYLCQNTLGVTGKTMRDLSFAEYQRRVAFTNERKRIFIAELAYLNARQTVDVFRDQKREQIKIIQNLISLIIYEKTLKGNASRGFGLEKQDEIDRLIKSAFHRCREQVFSGSGVVLAEWKELVTDPLSEVYALLKNLEEAWRLYEAFDREEHQALGKALRRVYSTNLMTRVGNLAAKHQYSELGLLLRESSSSLPGIVQGHLIEQVCNFVQETLAHRQVSERGSFRLQSMTLALAQEAMINHASIQRGNLSIQQQSVELKAAAVSQQTKIAQLIVENYKDFLEELLQIALMEEIEDFSKAIKDVEIAFEQKKVRLDEIVEAQANFIKTHAIDQSLLKESSEHAQSFLVQMVRIAQKLAKKNTAELDVFFARTQETWVSQGDLSLLEIEDDNVFIHRSWLYEGIQYQQDGMTLGDGACAIHALIGSKYQREYLWLSDPLKRDDPISVQKNAKNHFLLAIEPLIGSGRDLEAALFEVMEERIVETVEYRSHLSNFDEELSRSFEAIIPLLLNCYREHRETFDSVFVTTRVEFDKLKESLENHRSIEEPLMNCYRASYSDLLKLNLNDTRWQEVLAYEESRVVLEDKRANHAKQFVMNSFNLYAEIVRSSECYLSFEELKLAAHLLTPDKKVLVFYRFDAPPHVIHPTAHGEAIVIEHSIAYFPEGKHFSRLNRIV